MSDTPRYQPHIDGLRAIAVLSVVFYHYGVPGFAGGYLGVDVFFVISGFLITRIIHDELVETGRFDYRRFYIRRLRRLLPAFAVTLLFCLLAAAVLFSPDQFRRFGKSLAAAAFSFSNIHFWTESGYFDVASRLKPLLHTWSLSVEEQYYLVWPALMAVIYRHAGRRILTYALLAIGMASLIAAQLWIDLDVGADPRATFFYLMPFRAFEFVIGAAGVILTKGRALPRATLLHDLLMAAGLAAIGISVVRGSDPFALSPVSYLLPCCGALFVILATHSRIVAPLVTNPLAVGIGLVSYSLYLTHWPVLVFYEYMQFRSITPSEIPWLTATSLAMAVLLYFLVERPFRARAPGAAGFPQRPQRPFVVSGITSLAALGALGLAIGASHGWVWRNPHSISPQDISRAKQERRKAAEQGCRIDLLADPRRCKADRPVQVLIIGNSHEIDGFNAFSAAYGASETVNLISFGSLNDCRPVFENERIVSRARRWNCDHRIDLLNKAEVIKSLDVVVLSSNRPFSADKASSWAILRHLKRQNPNLNIIVLGGHFNTKHDCAEIYARYGTYKACANPGHVSFKPFNERARSPLEDARALDFLYIDVARLHCPEGNLASCIVEANGEPIMYDLHHLSLGFARFIGQEMVKRYGDELARAGLPRPGQGGSVAH